MKFFSILLFIFLNFSSFSQTKCPDEIKNFTGICCEFHPNGIISEQKKFKNGELVGEIKYYDEKGYLIINNSFDEPLTIPVEPKHSDSIYYFVEKEAIFPGGEDEMKKFIFKNILSPNSLIEIGKVYVKFIVEKDGSISAIEIMKAIQNCYECTEEVFRILKSMPKWIPAKINDKNVNCWVSLPINFYPNWYFQLFLK